jgi:putative ABC transport system permease protein
MIFFELIAVAWKSLMSNKSRSLLTMLGVIIGVAAVIIMMAISAGTEATIAEAINGLGSNLIFINSSEMRGGINQRTTAAQQGGLVSDDVTAIRDIISGVVGVSVEQQANVTLKFSDTTLTSVMMVGTTPDYTTVRDLKIGTGRFFTTAEEDSAEKVLVLGSGIAAKLFGDADPIGQTVNVTDQKLAVIGVLAPKGLSAGTDFDELVYCPITLVFKKFTPSQFARIMGNSVRAIYVSVDPKVDISGVVDQITILLNRRHNITTGTSDFTIRTQAEIIKTQESTTSSFRSLLAWVAGVSLIVGGIGIMNIMLVSVTERTKEIGLRQALGATPGDIQVQFLSEALMLSLFGGLLGVLAGVGGSYIFGSLSAMRTVIVPYSIALSFTSSALIGIFFGYVPAQKAAQLDPIVALRHE